MINKQLKTGSQFGIPYRLTSVMKTLLTDCEPILLHRFLSLILKPEIISQIESNSLSNRACEIRATPNPATWSKAYLIYKQVNCKTVAKRMLIKWVKTKF